MVVRSQTTIRPASPRQRKGRKRRRRQVNKEPRLCVLCWWHERGRTTPLLTQVGWSVSYSRRFLKWQRLITALSVKLQNMLKIEDCIYFNQLFHRFSRSCDRFASCQRQHSREVNIYMYVYIIICNAYWWIILTPKRFYSSPQEKTSKKRSRGLEDDDMYNDEEDGISLLEVWWLFLLFNCVWSV